MFKSHSRPSLVSWPEPKTLRSVPVFQELPRVRSTLWEAVMGLVGPVTVYCDRVRLQMAALCNLCVDLTQTHTLVLEILLINCGAITFSHCQLNSETHFIERFRISSPPPYP